MAGAVRAADRCQARPDGALDEFLLARGAVGGRERAQEGDQGAAGFRGQVLIGGEQFQRARQTHPGEQVQVAGGLAFGDVYFGDDLPEDVTFEFEVSAAPAAEDEATTRDLIVAEVNGTDTAVIGILRNPHAMTIGQPVVYVNIACFDESGQLLDVGYGQANKTAVDPDATTPFEHVLPNMAAALETETCPRYLVTGNGNALDP